MNFLSSTDISKVLTLREDIFEAICIRLSVIFTQEIFLEDPPGGVGAATADPADHAACSTDLVCPWASTAGLCRIGLESSNVGWFGQFYHILYRSSPFMFSILVAACPVLVCTAVLLGLLLSFGSLNIPEVEEKGEEEKDSHGVSSLKTGATEYVSIVQRDADRDGFVVERHVKKTRGIVENGFEKVSLVNNEGMSNGLLFEKKREMLGSDSAFRNVELAKDQSNLADKVTDRNLDVGKFAADFSDVPKDKDDDDYLDSGSDGSSPDVFNGEYNAERSHGSINDDSVDSDELENLREEDNDDNEGKGPKTDTEDESKSAIKWTEDDQKNLIELGTSELERNQRLEILMERRRACKNMNSMTEKNLINLDGAGISSHITLICTRKNPFELPYDSCDDLGLPPIPGSAPSILLPRNPFDLPCDSTEQIPVPKADTFPVDFSDFNQREIALQRESIFRRHESFNVGPSSFGFPRQELNWKPFFVPDRVVTEGTSFLRQLSEASDSKMSSVLGTELVSSVPGEEDNKPNEHGVSRETEPILNEDHVSVHDEQESQSSGNVRSINVILAENRDVHHDVVEIVLGGGENHLETESDLSEAATTAHIEFDASEIHSEREMIMEDSSKTDEEISDVKGEDFASFESEENETKESDFSTQPSFEESEFPSTSRAVDDNQNRQAVYDSSPPSLENSSHFHLSLLAH
ncbi:uncharacterized protein LOC120213680 [Hibiscus syriacus]|uniref:uncharacterized protein LOC120213680 n=1 Tax=Hibiscus syriacus TaxID=106335 RepID=UPI001924CEF0|nr:uncharacterized protein LOC120213680 [Hibiscus syriacus]